MTAGSDYTSPIGDEPEALAGLKVLELGSMLAGPFTSTLLGEFGAEVIKVEKPGKPDAIRQWPPTKDGHHLWWKSLGRNKRLVTLDISKAEAHEVALELITRADIVVENFRPGTLERWGFGPEALLETIPHTVWVRVSGWGQSGPYADQGGYATIAEAASGLSSITGFADRGPMVSPYPMGDYLAGTFAALGSMMALNHVRQCGQGQIVDVSLFEPLFRTLENMVVLYDQLGTKKPRLGNQMEEDVPRNLYRTADDGWIAISSGSQAVFEFLADAMERPDLKSDPRFTSAEKRAENRDDIDAIVTGWMLTLPTKTALERLEQAKMVAGAVFDVEAIFNDPHYAARGAITSVEDPDLGRLRVPAPVPKLNVTPGRVKWTGREPGNDNNYVYKTLLGMDETELAELKAAQVI